MPTWTRQQLREYEARNKTRRSHVEPVVSNALAITPPRGGKDSGKFAVVITSFRVRLVDDDALVGKYFVDALRYSGLLASDSAGALDYKVRQEKVASEADERTEIEVTPI